MSVYMLTALFEVKNLEEYEAYAVQARAVVEQHGGKFVLHSSGNYNITPIEGVAPDIVNLAIFKDKQTYLAFYQSPEYQALIPLRMAICKSQITMLEKT